LHFANAHNLVNIKAKGLIAPCFGACVDNKWLDFINLIIQEKHLKREPKVMDSRWWDYRTLHPSQATELFSWEYINAYKAQMRRRDDLWSWPSDEQYVKWKHADLPDDVEIGFKNPKGTKPSLFLIGKRESSDIRRINAMWKARLASDALGIPYNIYCGSILHVTSSRDWTRLPQPGGMDKKDYQDIAKAVWVRKQKVDIQYATNPIYLAERYSGLLIQDQYNQYLLDQAAQREHVEMALMTMIYIKRQLPEELARDRFGSDSVRRASNFYSAIK